VHGISNGALDPEFKPIPQGAGCVQIATWIIHFAMVERESGTHGGESAEPVAEPEWCAGAEREWRSRCTGGSAQQILRKTGSKHHALLNNTLNIFRCGGIPPFSEFEPSERQHKRADFHRAQLHRQPRTRRLSPQRRRRRRHVARRFAEKGVRLAQKMQVP
jgi:hypothetical protein